jgi:hypothetical protein
MREEDESPGPSRPTIGIHSSSIRRKGEVYFTDPSRYERSAGVVTVTAQIGIRRMSLQYPLFNVPTFHCSMIPSGE